MILTADTEVLELSSAQLTFGMSGCRRCRLFKQCGGHPLPFIFEVGCANFADADAPFDTDDMNPHFPERFWELWNDVDGLVDFTTGDLKALDPGVLPRYIPQFTHRHLRRQRLLDASIVALPLSSVVGYRKDGSYGGKFGTASALRRAYKLRQDTKVILTGVDRDRPLEAFWREHEVSAVMEDIGYLGVVGVTVPNFSYFTCVPRMQVLRNRKRIYLVAERMSAAGIRVSLHVNANTPGDWEAALEFLREHPEMSSITMEFQTGTRANAEVGRETFAGLVELRARLGRPLHPILVGAGRYYRDAVQHFQNFTVIDSQPFMQAKSRRILACDERGRFYWKKHPTPRRAPVDDLVETNLVYYEDKLKAGSIPAESREFVDPRQTLLAW